MTATLPRPVSDAQIHLWLGVLRDGTDDEKRPARRGLARVFEQRGMLDEATDLLLANVSAGERNAEIFRWLARLYRARGQEVLSMAAAAEAVKYLPRVDSAVSPNSREPNHLPASVSPPPAPLSPAPSSLAPLSPAPLPPTPQQHTGIRATGGPSGVARWRLRVPIGAVLLLAGLVVFGGLWGLSAVLTYGASEFVPSMPPLALTPLSGKAEVSLGTRQPEFGTSDQARELLKLMSEQPGRAEYQITYETTETSVLLGANLNSQTLTRIHVYSNAQWSKEFWHGRVLERLNAAAAGGSLSDAPNGTGLAGRDDV